MALRNLLVRVGADLSGLQKGMKQAQSQIASFGKSVNKKMALVGTALAAVGAVAALKPAIDDAIKYEALMGTIGETLGSTANDFVKWSETTGAAMGFSKLASAEMANTFSLKFKGIAKDAQDNFRMTTDLMKAAAIVRTKTGMAEVEIMDRLRSAMNQEADGADELGVNVRVAAITASNAYKQMANGVPWDKLNKNQQTLILQAYITDSIYSKLGNTVANNTALLKGNFLAALQDTKLALGQAFLPILNIALPLLTSLMRKVESAFKFFAGFMRALFPKSNIAAGAAQVKSTDNQTSSIGKQKGAVDGLTDSVKKLGKARKKASNGVAGFDQVNTLSSSAVDGGDGSGSGDVLGGLGQEVQGVQGDVDNLMDSISGLTDKVKAFADKVKAWIAPLKPYWDDLTEAIRNIGDAFSDIWNSKEGKALKTWLTSGWDLGISGLLEILAGFGNVFAGLLRTVWGGLTGDWKMMWEGAGDIVKGIIQIFNGTFGPLFPNMMKKVKEFTDGFKEKWNSLININWLALGVKAVAAFVKFKNDSLAVWNGIKTVITNKAGEVWGGIQGKFSGVGKWFTAKWGEITKSLGDAKTSIATKAGEIWSAIKGKFTDVYNWFHTNVTKKFIDVLAAKKKDIAGKASEIWGAIKGQFTDVYNWFHTSVTKKIMDVLAAKKKDIAGKASEIWSAIKGKFGSFTVSIGTSFASSVKGIINSVIKKINGFLGTLRSILQGFDKYIPGNVFHMSSIPNIPYLAKGGIVNSATVAMVGEQGKEAVMPLENNTGWITDLATMIANRGGASGSPGGDIVLNVDGRTLARIVKPHLDKENKRVGNNIRLKSV
ncbi:hypothetical protein V7152_14985 [Neobacillus drentensis]|uniref:phage tail protein n=1 Tax=Neobacillus drentensis TaxID=220684 RepID=UPI002FFE7E4A